MLRQKVFYSGNVQGVGFRQAVAWLARDFPVEGWVRNLPDGRVELAVQGDSAVIKRLLAKILVDTPGRIQTTEDGEWTSPLTSPSFSHSFRVRYDLNP